MANVFSNNAARGFASASIPLMSARNALSIYQYAKAKKDDDMMERAIVHMTKSTNDVKREAEASKSAQDEHMRVSRSRTNTEAPQDIEKVTAMSDADSYDQVINPADTVEISRKALAMQSTRNTESDAPKRGMPLIYNASSKPGADIETKKFMLDMQG